MKIVKKLAVLATAITMISTMFCNTSAVSPVIMYKGDINTDYAVDCTDIVDLGNNLVKSDSSYEYYADLNSDNCINVFDMMLLRKTVIGEREVYEAPVTENTATISVVDSETGEYIDNVQVQINGNVYGTAYQFTSWNTSSQNPKNVTGFDSLDNYSVLITELPENYTFTAPNSYTFGFNGISHHDIVIELTKKDVENTATISVVDYETGEYIDNAEVYVQGNPNGTSFHIDNWNTSDENPKTISGFEIDGMVYAAFLEKLPDGYTYPYNWRKWNFDFSEKNEIEIKIELIKEPHLPV